MVTMQNTPRLFDWEINIERVGANPLLKNLKLTQTNHYNNNTNFKCSFHHKLVQLVGDMAKYPAQVPLSD